MLTFALKLHDALAPDRTADVCWSPFSVASALGTTAQAARGRTADELTALLGDTTPVRETRISGDDVTFAVANTLWAWDALPVNESFLTDLSAWPGAAVRSAPFAEDVEAARKLINADVADTTRGLIPELLDRGAVKSDTVAALVNALYLKTAWTEEFPEHDTEDRPFRDVGDVPTMRREAKSGYAHAAGWQAVTIPAHGGVEAVVLLPDDDLGGLSGVPTVLGALQRRNVELFLPRLRAKSSALLSEPLRDLGVRTLFTKDADLTGLSPDPRLYVDEVVHEAVLRLDEQGLEGAAATAVMMRAVSLELPEEPVTVRVDRPYLLLVRHQHTGAVLFVAQVAHP
ncbi:serpin family protein [Saccharothrix violaceirubra]|uniref:Serpin B n=1 Tax=Saccharothrix violaceirubra TaxID=413306 RepID=A0A7W7T778_9PSEU|nr:serpin family protein [Saccharothrix violaceirubra]MBB4967844.1 serpin B [Saccharothrix violaceirubra]